MQIKSLELFPLKAKQLDLNSSNNKNEYNFNNISFLANKSHYSALNNFDFNIEQAFKPASDFDELKNQINGYSWLDKNDKINDYDFKRLKKKDFEFVSLLLYKMNFLSDDLKKKTSISEIFSVFERTHRFRDNVKNFNPQEYNKLLAGIQKNISSVTKIIIYAPILNVDEVNEIYGSMNDEYFSEIVQNCAFLSGNKEKNKYYLEVVKKINNIDLAFLKKVGLSNIFETSMPHSYILNLLGYFSSLSDEEKNRFSDDYLADIFNNNYSMALSCDCSDKTSNKSNFLSIKSEEDFKRVLASFKDSNNQWMFSDSVISQIVDIGNNLTEVSLILNLLKNEGLIENRNLVLRILLEEGITFKALKNKLDKMKTLKNDENLSDISSFLTPAIALSCTEAELDNIKNNSQYNKILKKYFPKVYKRALEMGCKDIFSVLKAVKLNPENFEMCAKLGLFSNLVTFDSIGVLLSDEKLKNVKPQNIRFLKQLIERDELAYIFNKNDGYSNLLLLFEIFTVDLDEDFDLNSKNEVIRLLYEDENMRKIFKDDYSACIKLLTKKSDDTYEDGKKLAKFFLDNYDAQNLNTKLFTTHSFSQTLDFISRYQKNPRIENQINSIGEASSKKIEQFIELADFVSGISNFDDCKLYASSILLNWDSKHNCSVDVDVDIDSNIDMVKSELLYFDECLNQMSDELKAEIKILMLDSILNNPCYPISKIKKQNIPCAEFLLCNKALDDYVALNSYTFQKVLVDNELDLETFKKKTNELLDFMDKVSRLKNFDVNFPDFIGLDCDYSLLYKKVSQIAKYYPDKFIMLHVDDEYNLVFGVGNNFSIKYDKNINLISRAKAAIKSEDTNSRSILSYADYRKARAKTYKIAQYKSNFNDDVLQKISIVHYDEDQNTLYTKIYKPSLIDGVYEISKIYPSGRKEKISFCKWDYNSSGYEKHLTSPLGDKTDVYYKKTDDGFEEFRYKITSKNSKVLCDFTRTSRVIDDNHRVTTFNDREYHIFYRTDSIEIYDVKENKRHIIDLKKFSSDNNFALIEMLKEIPADELIKMDGLINRITKIDKFNSSFNYGNRNLTLGFDKAIFEHEFGHAKKINDLTAKEVVEGLCGSENSRDYYGDFSELVGIYNQERRFAIENLPSGVLAEFDYFLGDEYANKRVYSRPLNELIAEVNLIQTMPLFQKELFFRTQFLQECFPRTIAYLMNNLLV